MTTRRNLVSAPNRRMLFPLGACVREQPNKISAQAVQSLFAAWLAIFFVFVSTGKSASLADFAFEFKPTASLPGQGAVNVHRPDNDGFLDIELILNLGMVKDPGEIYKRIKSIPLETISLWALTVSNSSLLLVKASPPTGVGNAGSADAHLFFRFACPKGEKPVAVVVKIYDEYRVFGIPAKQ